MSTPVDQTSQIAQTKPEPVSLPDASKPQWSRPEITSFKPVADAQGVAYRIGDGVSNLS
jgi:hypothetical protein